MRAECWSPAAALWLPALLLGLAGAAQAQSQKPAPRATLAERIASCTACHGPGGNATIATFPSLAGQPKIFIENQLVLIREGLRDVPAMKDVMAGMQDDEIVALAKHFAAQPVAPRSAPQQAESVRRGGQLSRSLLCGTCHLPGYTGQNQVPRLAGQNQEYLLTSMKEFRDHPGPGRDTIMAATLRGLSDTDLADLAHYLAGFKP